MEGHNIGNSKMIRHEVVPVLFTCVGKRVSLVEAFRRAGLDLRVKTCILGTDVHSLSPALHVCDQGFLVKPVTHRNYIRQLLAIVAGHGVRLIVPTVDLDLLVLAENRDRFEAKGCRVLVSDPAVVGICQDKRKTCRFLTHHGFDTPATFGPRSRAVGVQYPLVIKPWDGHASKYNCMVHDRRELAFFARRVPRAVCQPWVRGTEYTCDVYVDFSGRIRCVVPRQRIEVRSGEVTKARIVKDSQIMQCGADVVRALGAGPGVITVQIIRTESGQPTVIEINPRFGGGVPLAIRGGADFPKWILQELVGRVPRIRFDGFRDGLTLLRYDAEVWV